MPHRTTKISLENRVASRRQFLRSATGWVAGGGLALSATQPIWAAKKRADSVYGSIKITRIEQRVITQEFQDWIAYELNHYYGPLQRTILLVHTNVGLVGLGEWHNPIESETIEKYIGTSPFDWVGDDTSLGLGIAMYDLMGKAAGIPVYKLFGQRHRLWVPVCAWTVSTHPHRMVEAVKEYTARGYTWMKFHLSPFHNVLEQTAAIQEVAPKGFRIHYDITMHGTRDHMFELLEKLAQFPGAGCFEDPLAANDVEGHAELRRRARLPIVYHHLPLSASFEVLNRSADAYMLGHMDIGNAMQRAGLFAAANVPFMLQNVGGNITRAMTTHMQSAFRLATFHFISAGERFKSDVVNESLEPINGKIRVPEKPGLGVTINEAELERLENLKVEPAPKWIVKSRFDNGTTMYAIHNPKESIFMVRPDWSRFMPPMSYDDPVKTEYWDDDGSPEYKAMFARLEREQAVLIRG